MTLARSVRSDEMLLGPSACSRIFGPDAAVARQRTFLACGWLANFSSSVMVMFTSEKFFDVYECLV